MPSGARGGQEAKTIPEPLQQESMACEMIVAVSNDARSGQSLDEKAVGGEQTMCMCDKEDRRQEVGDGL